MPSSTSVLCAVAFAVLPLALGGCRSEPRPPPAAQSAPDVKGPPAAMFVRIPAVSRVTLSPDGKRIAGMSSNDGVQVVFESSRTSVREVNHLTRIAPETVVHALGWAGNGVLLVGYEQPDASVERDLQSRRSPDGVVYDVESVRGRRERGREFRMVGMNVGTWRQRPGETSWPVEVHPSLPGGVIHWLPDDPERVLINSWKSSEIGASAQLARVRDGAAKPMVPASPGMNVWYADHRGDVRAGSGRSEDGLTGIVVARIEPDAPFTELTGVGISQETDFAFAGFDAKPNIVYLTAIGASGRRELFAYDLTTRLRKAVYANPSFDVGSLVNSPQRGELWAVEVDAEKPELHFFDKKAEREQAAIDKALPGTTNRIVSFDADAKQAIVLASGDTTPPDYYRFDRERRRMDFLFTAYPTVDRAQLAQMKPVRYKARDGLQISGYLTLPRNAAAKNLPAIVIVHDGPSQRVRWGWDPVVQFLASRGFAVFQPNYRGSTGYGREHERMGYGQWGLAMQNDLEDGVRWLVAEGIANPTRVGIYGIGYGGYAALLAAAKTPELFRAAASFGAVTDLAELLEHPEQHRSADLNNPVEGKLPGDRAALAALSPARLGAQVRIPVFVAHGLEDPVVNAAQSRAMVDALEDAGGAVESAFYRDELHELGEQSNRVEFHEKLAAFFARHLALASL
jgi:dipeptidyl aminopeptidase/acylaminoacyl peptidase